MRHDRRIVFGGLLVIVLLAWLYLLTGAGLGMDPWSMTLASLFPQQGQPSGMTMPDMTMPGIPLNEPATEAWSFGYWGLMVLMWWIMMIAMMTPSAAPMILLHARVLRHAQAKGRLSGDDMTSREGLTSAWLTAGYLAAWLGFSLAAVLMQWALEQQGLLSAMTMGSRSVWLSAGLLILAGFYQLSPLKQICLRHCRAPADFLSRHWRKGRAGAFVLGLRHGAFCVGCCWVLMALLFVGGVMNLLWIAVLAVFVLIEKVTPRGVFIGRAAGVLLLGWGVVSLLA